MQNKHKKNTNFHLSIIDYLISKATALQIFRQYAAAFLRQHYACM